MVTAWYIARARLGRARWVAESIREELGFLTLCPVEIRKTFTRFNFSVDKLQPIFGPYFFFQPPTMDDHAWHDVSGWPYVVEIMGGAAPWPVGEWEIAFWQKIIDFRGIVIDPDFLRKLRRGFEIGDQLRIMQGPYEDRLGICVWIDDRKMRVGVEIDLLGRKPVIYVPAAWCTKEDAPHQEMDVRRPHQRGGRRGQRVRQAAQLRANGFSGN